VIVSKRDEHGPYCFNGPRQGRRAFLATMGMLLGLSGCTDSSAPVTVMTAGSLSHPFEEGLVPQCPDISIQLESHGSVAAARLVTEASRDPDIVSLADPALFDGPLHPDGYVTFATNALVLVYNPDTPAGRWLAAADSTNWYVSLLEEDVELGRTDPDLDPLGYRTLFALTLAERYHDVPELSTRLLHRDQIYPETALISQFEVGAIDAAFAYRSMAVSRGYAYVDLPPQINLSDPGHEDEWYATASYRLPDDTRVQGTPIRYASAIRHVRPEARSVFRQQCRGAFLQRFGFSVPDHYPRVHGTLPDGVSTFE